MKWRWIALVCVLVVAAGLGALVHFGPATENDDLARGEEVQLVPLHRERTILLEVGEPAPAGVDPARVMWIADVSPSQPDAETRRRFDGRWTGDSDAGPVTVLLLGGVGDLIVGSGLDATVWGIEILRYLGDENVQPSIWQDGGDRTDGVARYLEKTDSLLVEFLNDVGMKGLPESGFTVHRDKPNSR